MSHKHRLKGIELYETMVTLLCLVKDLQAKKDHEVLQSLHTSLFNSIAGLQTDYSALKCGQKILNHLGDLLYGFKNEEGKRDTTLYKQNNSAVQIKQNVEEWLSDCFEKHKTHSSQMRGYLKHFEHTYQNWKTYLFTCYDYPQMPNDNNALELSHSQMKKQYRRITGQKSTAKYLKVNGQQAAFTLPYMQAQEGKEIFEDILRQTDYSTLKKQKRVEKQNSQMRGKTMATQKKLNTLVIDMKKEWGLDC